MRSCTGIWSRRERYFNADGQFRTDLTVDEIDIPENVRLIIGRRLDRLDENEKRVLAAATVIGRSFSFQLLNAISQIGVDELFTIVEKAQQMGIIIPSSEGPERPFTFGHELVRQTLLAGTSAPRRQRLHAKSRTRSSASIPLPSASMLQTSRTIFSKLDRSLMSRDWPII